jgi:hypothetical protein
MVASLIGFALAATVNISNLVVRHDIHGVEMDTHDGNIQQWTPGGVYYLYAMGYQNCTLQHGLIPPVDCPGIYKPFGQCGFRTDHAVRIYTSPDLLHWTLVSLNAFPVETRPYGIYYRPKVIRNAQTNKYLLWINFLANASSPLAAYPSAGYMVASSDSPHGPFSVITKHVAVANSGGGDFAILVTKDQEHTEIGYIAYDSWANSHRIVIEQLNANFTDSLGAARTTGPISPPSNEAPIVFERKGWFYLIFGSTCCFCQQGAGAQVWAARHPLGPWNSTGVELNPLHKGARAVSAQNSFVFLAALADGTTSLVFASDRWASAADRLKSHVLQYWQPLVFDDSAIPARIAPLVWQDWITLAL